MPVVRFARAMRVVCLATCALLSACATPGESTSRTQKNSTAPAPTLLHFDWGDELEADVFAIREEFTFKGDSEHVSRLEARFHLRAERRADRYLLMFSDLHMKLDCRAVTETGRVTPFC